MLPRRLIMATKTALLTPEENYFYWLCDTVGGAGKYEKMLRILFNKDYYWLIAHDDDRVLDGIRLREIFSKFFSYNSYLKLGQCKVLEVLVSLAISCEDDIMHVSELGDRTYVWFWIMIENLGLTDARFEDKNMGQKEAQDVVDRVDFMLERKYGNDGIGSLFPVEGFESKNAQISKVHYSRLDLWTQLNRFMTRRLEEVGYL